MAVAPTHLPAPCCETEAVVGTRDMGTEAGSLRSKWVHSTALQPRHSAGHSAQQAGNWKVALAVLERGDGSLAMTLHRSRSSRIR